MPTHFTRRHRRTLATTIALSSSILWAACGASPEATSPPADDGAAATSVASDPARAQAIAAEMLDAVGGAEGWDATRFITWVNHGKRLQVWDKQTGDLRVQNDAVVILMNLESGEGRAWRFGEEITDPADVERTLDFGREAFMLDSHEILLPFLLQEEGVHLDYLGDGEVEGAPVDVLKVTFDEGAPYSRAEYHLNVDKESRLLVRWDYYYDRGDARPRFRLPWSNYEKYGTILLSDQRGQEKHQDVNVFDELPASVFESPEPVPWLRAEGEPAP